MIDVANEPRVLISIVGDIAAETNISRIVLLMATMRIKSKIIWAKPDVKDHNYTNFISHYRSLSQ